METKQEKRLRINIENECINSGIEKISEIDELVKQGFSLFRFSDEHERIIPLKNNNKYISVNELILKNIFKRFYLSDYAKVVLVSIFCRTYVEFLL